MSCNSCNDVCCPQSGQLCVDASFFVPQCDNECEVDSIYFASVSYIQRDGMYFTSNVRLPEGKADIPITWNPDSAVSSPTDPIIGHLTFNYILDDVGGKCSFELNCVEVYGKDLSLGNNYSQVIPEEGCTPYTVFFGNHLNIKNLTGLSGDANNGVNAELYFGGNKIAQIVFGVDGTNSTANGVSDIFKEFYVKVLNGLTITGPLPDTLVEAITISSEIEQNICEGRSIVEANLCLQLRANKNNLYLEGTEPGQGEDPDSIPDGTYEICLTYKNCSGRFQNRSLIKIHKQGANLNAFWGRDTSKAKGSDPIPDCNGNPSGRTGTLVIDGDSAMVIGRDTDGNIDVNQGAKVTVCGTIQDVLNNCNDFVICVEEVMQSFNLCDIMDAGLNGDWDTAKFNEAVLRNPAKLANTKLYLSIKAVCWVPNNNTETQDLPPPGCCAGSLNPFDTTKQSKFNPKKLGHYETKGFCTCEITNMLDHPVRNSRLPREITCCLSKDKINEFLTDCEC